jgi:hypothetical protein
MAMPIVTGISAKLIPNRLDDVHLQRDPGAGLVYHDPCTIAGGLVGVLAPTGGQARSSPPSREQRPPAE